MILTISFFPLASKTPAEVAKIKLEITKSPLVIAFESLSLYGCRRVQRIALTPKNIATGYENKMILVCVLGVASAKIAIRNCGKNPKRRNIHPDNDL